MSSYFLRTLFVHTPGTRLVLEKDAVRALRDDAPPRRLPLNAIDSIVVLGGVDVSTPLIVRCAEDGRTVAFLSRYGKPRAVVEGAPSGRGQLRRLQYERHFDVDDRAALARSLVSGKIVQMQWGLRQWARDAALDAQAQLAAIVEALSSDRDALVDQTRAQALGTEGVATRRYFAGVSHALKADVTFTERTRRPPRDPMNAALSFLYAMSRLEVHGAVHASGLDAYCGFLHGDRDGQPSLVLDLMEEFRPDADRLAVTLFNRRELREEHFETTLGGGCSLNLLGRDAVMTALYRHRNQDVRLKSARLLIPRAAVPIVQANHLANALRSGNAYRSHELVLR